MLNLKVMNVNRNNVFTVVKQNIYNCVTEPVILTDTKFHHQFSINKTDCVLEHGLLSYRDYVHIVEGRELTQEEIYKFGDDYHVNGLGCISLSTMDFNKDDMYPDELLWGTYEGISPDIIVSKKVRACHDTTNYYNEYIVSDSIPVDMFNSIDVRLLRLGDPNVRVRGDKVDYMLNYYEALRKIAIVLKEKKLNIPLRETSKVYNLGEDDKALSLDVNKVIEMPKLVLK